MRKIFSVVFLLFFTSIMLMAQRAHVVYAEGFGSGVLWSVNYDVRFNPEPGGFGSRLGVSVIENLLIIPLQLNYTSGKKHGFEAGFGTTMFFDMDNGNDGSNGANKEFCPSATLMYRYQGPKGFNFRLGFTPMYSMSGGEDFISNPWFLFWPGASVGYRL
jgi:hypothetical protein